MLFSFSQTGAVASIQQWAEVFVHLKKSHHWQLGRSAYELAAAMLRNPQILDYDLEVALNGAVALAEGRIEWETRFDGAKSGPRAHDLGVFGTAGQNSLFVGVEAKVDEPFGQPVAAAWQEAHAKQQAGMTTQAPQRIAQLMDAFLPGVHPSTCGLPYQLFTAAAGTLAEGRECSVLYLLILKTGTSYDPQKGQANRKAFEDFVAQIGAVSRVTAPGQPEVLDLLQVRGNREPQSSLSPLVFQRPLTIIWHEI